MKYKIIQNQIIIAALDGLTYVKQQGNGLIVPCRLDKGACGIISDGGALVWHLEGLPAFPFGEFDTVKAVEITDEEYEVLREALAVDEEIVEPEPVSEPEPDPAESGESETGEGGDEATQDEGSGETIAGSESPEPVMSGDVMRQKVLKLEEEVARLTAINEALVGYHVNASDSSINSIAKIRGVSSQTVTEVSEITGTQEGANENDGTHN